jgi:hypothetical protein
VLGETSCQPLAANCPTGFHPFPDGVGCEATLPSEACQGATRTAFGANSCVPIGDCAAPPPADADTFVDPTLPDGALDAHHVRTIGAALELPAAKVIAIAKGTYAERITVPRSGMKLVGQCAGEVIVDGASLPNPQDGVVLSGVTDVALSGMTIRANKYGINAQGGATVEVSGVVVEKSVLGGLFVSGAGSSLRISESSVRDGYGGSVAKLTGGIGAQVDQKAHLEVVDSSFERTVGMGVSVLTNGVVDLDRVAIVDTAEDDDGTFGVAVIQRGATVQAKSTAIRGTRELGFGCFGGACSIRDSSVDAVSGSSARELARGIQMIGGKTRIENVTVSRAAQVGMWAETKANVAIVGTIVRQIGAGGGSDQGAIIAIDETTMSIDRSIIFKNSAVSIRAQDKGTTLDIKDTTLAEVLQPVKTNGRGLEAWDGAKVSFRHGSIERVLEAGVLSLGAGSELVIEDSVVDKIDANAQGIYGFGLAATNGAKLTARRVPARWTTTMGVISSGAGSVADISDLYVADTGVMPAGARFGRGLQVQEGGNMVVARATLLRSTEIGAAVVDPGSSLELSEALVASTQFNSLNGAGRGVHVAQGSLILRDSVVVDSIQAGIAVALDGTEATLDHVTISRTKPDSRNAFGHGVVVDSALVRANDVVVRESWGSGLAFLAAAASVARSRIESNAIGISVSDASLIEQRVLPPMPQSRQVVVSSDTVFTDNATRVGGGALALPELDETVKSPTKTASSAKP